MKPVAAASQPPTSPQSGSPSRPAKDKVGGDGQNFSDVLGQHEELIKAQPADGEHLGKPLVPNQNEAEMLVNAGREQDEITQKVSSPPVSTVVISNATAVGNTQSVELDQPSLHEVEIDQLKRDPASDLTDYEQNIIGEFGNTRTALKPVNDKPNSQTDIAQFGRLTSQPEEANVTAAAFPRTILEVDSLREGKGSASVEHNVQVTTNKESSPPRPLSKSVISDPHQIRLQEDQRRQKSDTTNFVQPVSVKGSSAVGDSRSNAKTEKITSFLPKATAENVPTPVLRTASTDNFQSVLFDKVEREERVQPVLQFIDSYEVSESSAVSPQKAASEKPVGSQIVQFLLSNLPEARSKSAANAAPIFAPDLRNSVVVKSLNLVLQPDNLGTVKIELSLKNQNLTVEIIAENAEAVDKLQASQETINQRMKSDGYVIDQFLIKASDVSRIDEANRNLEKYSAMENNEAKHSGSKENDASGFGGNGSRQDEQRNIPVVDRVAETDWRSDDEIYL